jgi:hypothetical protein
LYLEVLESRVALSTWIATGANPADWNAPGNWSGGQVPGVTQGVKDATFDGGSSTTPCKLSLNITINTLTVNANYSNTIDLKAFLLKVGTDKSVSSLASGTID